METCFRLFKNNKQVRQFPCNFSQVTSDLQTLCHLQVHRYKRISRFTVGECKVARPIVTVWHVDRYWLWSESQEEPAVIPSCCSHQFYPPAERKGKNQSQPVKQLWWGFSFSFAFLSFELSINLECRMWERWHIKCCLGGKALDTVMKTFI